MNCDRILTLVTLPTLLWASACGDGGTAPPPPAPEPSRPTTVTVSPATAELDALGATVRLSAQVSDQNGQAMAGATVTWASGDASVATVDASGLATAVANGTATVTARAGSASASATLTVAQEAAGSLVLAPDSASLGGTGGAARMLAPDSLLITELGVAAQLLPMGTDANGRALGPGANVTWASSTPTVATVDAAGLVTAVANGRAEVTATSGPVSGKLVVLVSDLSANANSRALVALYEATGGDAWTNRDNWLTHAPLEEWHGVGVDGEGRVDSLRLSRNNLTGSIPPTLGNLANLKNLEIYGNNLTGAIPPELGNLASLEELRLGRNSLTGSIPPELGKLAHLKMLSLQYTDLTGGIPPELGNLADLESLYLNITSLTGAIPPELGSLANLQLLWLSNNPHLSGSLPTSFLELGALRDLRIHGTNLCAPADQAFQDWLNALDRYHGQTCAAGSAAMDRSALVALYEGTGGPDWVDNENWLTDAPLGEWYGVDTDAHGRVVRLHLGGKWDAAARRWAPHGLSGTISPELGNLGNLERLTLAYNNLTGAIPPELGDLANLRDLHLAANNLTGSIPSELGNLANFESLTLAQNNLTGAIPPELGNLPDLQWLNFARNQLVGAIPPELGNLANLETLWLDNNNLTGTVPPELGNLASLQQLNLSGNGLTGTIPPELGKLANLRSLWLSQNNLTGTIPSELGSLRSLEWLRLNHNPQLSGSLPATFLELDALRDLRIHGTDLCAPADQAFQDWLDALEKYQGQTCTVGSVDMDRSALVALYEATGGNAWTNNGNWLTDAPLREWYGVTVDGEGRVARLDLHENNLTGDIPSELGNLANLKGLLLYQNNLAGTIPPELGNLANLQWLTLYQNNLTGDIPPELGNLANLQWLTLYQNNLTGDIPPELGNLASLKELRLGRNSLTGSIPPELGKLAHLKMLSLQYTDLTGAIPHELANLADLKWLLLHENNLTGSIPSELGNLVHLDNLNFGGNNLVGTIPPELGNLVNLRGLYFDRNPRLSGVLPTTFLQLGALRFFSIRDTEVCAPFAQVFQDWLRALEQYEGRTCPAPSLPVSSVPTNGGSVDAQWHQISGEWVPTALVARRNPGYDFERWSNVNGRTLSTDSIYSMEVGSDSVIARFSVNRERGKWTPGGTYTWYDFESGNYGVDSISWTFVSVKDPPESLRQNGLLHYYAMNFGVTNSINGFGRGYAGFQSNGLVHNRQWGKTINFAIWRSNGGRTDGQLETDNAESSGYRILYEFPWVEGRAYRFVLAEGPSGTDDEGKWWGLWVTDLSTGSETFIGEQRVPTTIEGRPSTTLSPRGIHMFGEDLHWWRASPGITRYVCSDFVPSSLAILDVRAGSRKPTKITNIVNGGVANTWSNGHATVNCHVTIIDGGNGDVQHNLGFWPEPPRSVVPGSN